MAPVLRKSTKDKTRASADAADEIIIIYRKPTPRNKRFLRTKGLVNFRKSKRLQNITYANANSPLLRLPAEIRNTIFEIATYEYEKIGLYFNRKGNYSRSGYSTRVQKSMSKHAAFTLPQVCRQIYAETATLIYRVNTFSFATHRGLKKWISKRLPAELEAVEHLELLEGDADERKDVLQQLIEAECPNVRSLTQDQNAANEYRRYVNPGWDCDSGNISTDDEETQARIEAMINAEMKGLFRGCKTWRRGHSRNQGEGYNA
ncbi:hypothetical protein OPT61_g5329 [Boeremia exigua]|uniref:Uncharacterized protein n=1 Tax=Boeremia exigua TaxID=749465 RepID=A0ACC2IAV9_9PLEO|nr:hypothetical protein OPT61_g5329 [Boeremia exigua]